MSGIFIVNFEQISLIDVVFPLFTLNKQNLAKILKPDYYTWAVGRNAISLKNVMSLKR